MRALLYLLTLTFSCFLKNGYCVISFKEFISNDDAMSLVRQYHNNEFKREELLTELNNRGHEMNLETLKSYIKKIKEAGGGSRINNFDQLNNDPRAISLVAQYHNDKTFTKKKLLTELENIGIKMGFSTLGKYLNRINKAGGTSYLPNQSQSTEFWDFSNPAPFIQAPQIAQQSSNFTSGNPGSSTSALNKGKSINFSKESNPDNWPLSSITGSAAYYGSAMPSQQVPPMDDDTFVPSQVGTDSTDWFGENFQSNDGSLHSMVNPENPRSSHYGGAMPYQQAPMPDTFMPSHTETHSSDWFGENLQNDDGSLASVVEAKKPSSSKSTSKKGKKPRK